MRLKCFGLFLVLVFLVSLAGITNAAEMVIDLVAGQHEIIGNVTVVQNGSELIVTYQTTEPGWCLTTTQLYVGEEPPQRHSPGRFPYKHENLDCVTSDTFIISGIDSDVYIAAHADAYYSDQIILGDGSVTFTLAPSVGTSYFNNTVTGSVNGYYTAWCVDVDHAISIGTEYQGQAFSSLGALPAGVVDHPENMDLVNYVLNQDYLSQGMSYGDIQLAIWMLIDDTTTEPGPYTPGHAEAIVADALANGEGFVPSCGDILAVVVVPEVIAQTTIIEYTLPCLEVGQRGETAWAIADNAIDFNQGWGSYFLFTFSSQGPNLTDTVSNLNLAAVISALDTASQSRASLSDGVDGDKVTICHSDGNSGHWVEVEISANGLNGFFNDDGSPRNGRDYEGECQD